MTFVEQRTAGFSISSNLAASAEEVWEHATSMDGVNYELGPLVRMSVPRRARGLSLEDAPIGEVAFRSVILAGSILPVDRHSLTLVEVGPERRFLERSSSLVQRSWEHERTVEEAGDGCLITDRLLIEPRLRRMAPLAGAIARHVFEHRHERLRERFGSRG